MGFAQSPNMIKIAAVSIKSKMADGCAEGISPFGSVLTSESHNRKPKPNMPAPKAIRGSIFGSNFIGDFSKYT